MLDTPTPHQHHSRSRAGTGSGLDHGPCGHTLEEVDRVYIAFSFTVTELDGFPSYGPEYGKFQADYKLFLARVGRSHITDRMAHARTRRSSTAATRHLTCHIGNSPARPIACTNSAKVLGRSLAALDSYEFALGRPMGP